jgi:hypothetical protein
MIVTEGPDAAASRRRPPLLHTTVTRMTEEGEIFKVWATVAMKAVFAASVLKAWHVTLLKV